MRLAKNAFLVALTMLTLIFSVSAQILRSEKDDRNPAPTVGTGGPVGGPTGLFTVYDGQTLRRGEFTFSVAYSNYDRDPGNVDITETPLSFQIGLSNNVELFFNTDGLRRIKVNSPQNLSSFYLPNSRINGVSPAAIVLAPQGSGTTQFVGPIYRPAGTAAFCVYPYTGCNAGNFGFTVFPGNPFQIGPYLGFPVNTNPTLGPPRAGGDSGSLFPGVGSTFGGILPGIVLSTVSTGGGGATDPVVYTLAPSYLPDAPFINRTYGETSFNSFVIGGKIRFTSAKSPVGVGIIPFYRFYSDNADDAGGFNQLQRGAGPGTGGFNPFSDRRGDIGLTFFADVRARNWINISGNVGYIYNSSVKADIGGTEFTLLDRPDEFQYAVGLDFPVNKYFQPILEFRQTRYVGGRTPNAFENDPMDGLAGVRIFPARWFGFSAAYRYNFNQQDRGSVEDIGFNQNVRDARTVLNAQNNVSTITFSNRTSSGTLGSAFTPSNDPHGFMFQFFAGHRNARGQADIPNLPANVTALDLDRTTVVLPCADGFRSTSGSCGDVQTVGVRTTAVDPEGDVLTYSYTVSGGRITGQGANVTWDLSGARPGTYTITSAVDDGCGFCGTPKTTSVTVGECNDCVAIAPECTCATISVTPPSSATAPGDTMTFTANVSGGSQTDVTYNWSVSAGTIVEGQGTPVIRVSTAGLQNTNITATVDVGGQCAECPRIFSESGIVSGIPVSIVVIEIEGVQQADEIKQRVDQFFTELANNPSATGTIINYGTDREVAKRKADIEKAIAFRNYDISRVTFVRGGSEPGIRTRFFLVPAGAEQPTP